MCMNVYIESVHVCLYIITDYCAMVDCTTCRHLGSQLAEMEKAIEKMMEADFVHFALEDICHRLPAMLRKDGLHLTNSEMESSEVQYMNIATYMYMYSQASH